MVISLVLAVSANQAISMIPQCLTLQGDFLTNTAKQCLLQPEESSNQKRESKVIRSLESKSITVHEEQFLNQLILLFCFPK